MAKEKKTETVVAEEPRKVEAQIAAPALVAGTTSIAVQGASEALVERMNEVKDNLESVENFRLPRAKMTATGLEIMEGEPLVHEMEGVIVHTKKTNVYYKDAFNPNDLTPPDCYSLDGVTPAQDMTDNKGQKKAPIHPTCKGCPMAEFGTNSMKSGKACRNLKPLFILMENKVAEVDPETGDESGKMKSVLSIMPRQLTVSPSSLKLANQYLLDLTERGISYRKVRTKVTLFKENPKDTYYKMKFAKGMLLDPQLQKDVEYIRAQWLPIMNNQIIDQGEFETNNNAATAQAAPQADGDY